VKGRKRGAWNGLRWEESEGVAEGDLGGEGNMVGVKIDDFWPGHK
jgi:hypothetical protein